MAKEDEQMSFVNVRVLELLQHMENCGGEETTKNEQNAQNKHFNNQPNSSIELSTK